MRTRIAPTPSGFIHAGNLVNFVICAQIATERNADVVLRIDDLDQARVRAPYVEDVFRVLDWLGIAWHEGPRSSADLPTWSQVARMDAYREARDALVEQTEIFFVCTCTRTDYSRGSTCTCGSTPLPLETGRSALRMRTRTHGAPVMWRRDGLPAYHLASVVDDAIFDVDLVVRGVDLWASTEIQRTLARHLPGSTFARATVVHHGLVSGTDGSKLSKSAGASASPLELTEDLRAAVDAWARRLRSEDSAGDRSGVEA